MWGTERPSAGSRTAQLARHAAALAALAWSAHASPQAPTITDADLDRVRRAQPVLTERDIDDARRRHGGTGAVASDPAARPAPLQIDALPQPRTNTPLDLEAIARGYGASTATLVSAPGLHPGPGLMVFISLAVPRPTLDRLLDQAARAGATVVLRGFVQGSLRTTVAEVQALIGQRQVAVQIDPPAFDRFAVTQVPSVVLVRDGARPVSCASGTCAPPEAFVKAAGDVSLDHALDHIQRAAPTFQADAALFLTGYGREGLVMRPRLLSCLQRAVVWCTLGGFVVTQAGAQSQAHREGLTAGQAVQSVVRGGITTSGASAVVPGYTAAPPERAHHGQPNLSGASHSRLAACALTPGDPVCQALLGAQASAQTPRARVLPYDPAVLAARRVAANPGAVLEDLGSFYRGCQVDTAPTAATEPRICRQGSRAATAACARTLTVEVERTDSCAPGSWTVLPGSPDLQLAVQCLPDQPQQRWRATDRQAAPLVFHLDVGAARAFPQPVQPLSPLAWGDAARWLWIVDDVCRGHDCQMTGYVAEPSRRVCRTEGEAAEVCTDETPFLEDASRPGAGYRVNPQYGHNPALALRFTRPHTTVTETDRWDDRCPVAASDSRCRVTTAARCVDGPATKLIDGVPVTRACWRYDTALSCHSGAATDECAPLAAAGCTPTASVCRQTHPATGACDLTENTYACPVAATTTVTARNCPVDVFCVAGSCFSTAHPPDADFARAMTFLEAAREAGVYLDTDRLEVFRGEPNRCRDRLLKNCCMTDAAGRSMSNQSIYGTGSRLVYDVLMNAGNRAFLYHGTQALLTSGGFSGSFSSYGVTVAVNGTALPAGSSVLYAGESLVVAFDPWSLVIAIVIYVVMAALSCDAEEGQLAMKEGARLCHPVGTYCSSCIRVHGRCVSCRTYTTNKCCFNSALARIIQQQGRQQLGKSWGGARNPDCSGFTVAQLQRLDFGRMDLREFYASIVPTLPNAAAVQGGATGQASHCTYGEGRCP